MSAKFTWTNKKSTVDRLVGSDKIGKFVSMTCMRYMDPYVPRDSGMLSENTNFEPFKVIYNQPYARKHYYGKQFDEHRNRESHPNATSYWDKAMIAARRNQIAKEISDFIRRI